MFKKKKKDDVLGIIKAYEAGKNAGSAITDAVDAFFATRVKGFCENYLYAFSLRLTTIYDEKAYTPIQVAIVELKIFNENIFESILKMRTEIEVELADWIKVSKEIGVGHEIDSYINNLLKQTGGYLIDEAEKMIYAELKITHE